MVLRARRQQALSMPVGREGGHLGRCLQGWGKGKGEGVGECIAAVGAVAGQGRASLCRLGRLAPGCCALLQSLVGVILTKLKGCINVTHHRCINAAVMSHIDATFESNND